MKEHTTRGRRVGETVARICQSLSSSGCGLWLRERDFDRLSFGEPPSLWLDSSLCSLCGLILLRGDSGRGDLDFDRDFDRDFERDFDRDLEWCERDPDLDRDFEGEWLLLKEWKKTSRIIYQSQLLGQYCQKYAPKSYFIFSLHFTGFNGEILQHNWFLSFLCSVVKFCLQLVTTIVQHSIILA